MEKENARAVNKIKCHTQGFVSDIMRLFNSDSGFTLIELLVVVLIIGILASIALPQYQKAVERSKATQAITLLKSVYSAAKAYQMANGEWPTSFDELSVNIPWTEHTNWYATGLHKPGLSNKDWSIQIRNAAGSQSTEKPRGLVVGRLSGPYAGAAFYIYSASEYTNVPIDTLVCVESHSQYTRIPFGKTRGSYCSQIMGGTFLPTTSAGNWDYFSLP